MFESFLDQLKKITDDPSKEQTPQAAEESALQAAAQPLPETPADLPAQPAADMSAAPAEEAGEPLMTRLVASLTEAERSALAAQGITAELFNECSDEEKVMLLIHFLVYARQRGLDLDDGIRRCARRELSLPDPLLRRAAADLDGGALPPLDFRRIFLDVDESLLTFSDACVQKYLQTKKRFLTGLLPQAYEHPLDTQYLGVLKGTPGLDFLCRKLIEYGYEPLSRIQYTGSNLQVTGNLLGDVHEVLEQACEILDIDDVPELYVQQGFLNACTIGDAKPLIVVHSLSLTMLSRDELLFLLGHELGHIKSRHMLYHMVGDALPVLTDILGPVTLGLGKIVSTGMSLALQNWHRMSEFTADRAGLLCCQNINAAMTVFMKLSGLPYTSYGRAEELIPDFMSQARAFDALDGSAMNKVLKFCSIIGEDHPWNIVRARELLTWHGEGYRTFLPGA